MVSLTRLEKTIDRASRLRSIGPRGLSGGASASPKSFRGPRRKPSRRLKSRLGAALVEFALVAPLMIMFTMGLIEIGRLTMVKNMLLNASRDGARLASLQGSTNDQVTASVQQSVSSMALNNCQIAVTPFPLSSTPAGANVQVTISVSANSVSWIPAPLFTSGKTVTATTSMRRESP